MQKSINFNSKGGIMVFFSRFWQKHGERLIFMALSMLLATLLFQLDMQAEAKVIFIGSAMMCFNKARSPDADDKEIYPAEPKPIDDKEDQ
jgi:hypothetical protein